VSGAVPLGGGAYLLRGLDAQLGLGGPQGSRISGDGGDSHPYWRGLHESFLLRPVPDASRPKQYQEHGVDRLFFPEALADTPFSLIKRNLPETP